MSGYWVLSIHIQPPFNAFDTMWTCQSLASGTVGGGEKGIQYLIWVLRSLPSIVFDTMWTCEWMARPGEGQLNTQYSIVRPMNPYPRTPHSIGFGTRWRVSGWPVRPKGGGELNTQYSIVRPMNLCPRTLPSIAFDTCGRVSGWPVRTGGGQINIQYSIVRPMNPYPRSYIQ